MGVLLIIAGLVSIGLAIRSEMQVNELTKRMWRGEVRLTWRETFSEGLRRALKLWGFGGLGLVLIVVGGVLLAQG